MILKLDPRRPMVWRSPSSLQVGIDPAVIVLDDVTETQERVLAALAVGVSDAGLGIVARGAMAEARELLELVAPALLKPEPEPQPTVVAISGSGPLVDELSRLLGASGVHALVSERPDDLADHGPDLAVAVGHFVLPPALHALWLRRDVPHVPAVFSDTGLVIGPIVEPGTGPCLRCLELHRLDADPAWPALATQVLGRRGCAESALLATEGAAAVGRLVLARLEGGAAEASVSLRIDGRTGERTTMPWLLHPDCGCRGIAHLVASEPATKPRRRGTDWAAAVRRAPVPELRTR